MMELIVEQKKLLQILDAVTSITREPTMVFEPDGLSVVDMNPEQHCMVVLSAKPAFFGVYKVDKEGEKLKFDLVKATQMVKGMGVGEIGVTVGKAGNKINLVGKSAKYSLPIFESDGGMSRKEPTMGFTTTVKITPGEVVKAAEDVHEYCDTKTATLEVRDVLSGKVFVIRNSDMSGVMAAHEFKDCLIEGGAVKSNYPSNYIMDICSGLPGELVKIELLKDAPMRITAQGIDENLSVHYWVAPRVDNE